ncbi:hypothetical protein GGR51DRAFT_544107 [Nemania sp. FL0031]|nr:hypothetical protein GGR51DRAFT_544107 [Nemania sp. FL0031]
MVSYSVEHGLHLASTYDASAIRCYSIPCWYFHLHYHTDWAAIFYLPTLIASGAAFVWSLFWAYGFVDLDRYDEVLL